MNKPIEMPSLEELLTTIAEVRAKYRPEILAARKEAARQVRHTHGLAEGARQIQAEERDKQKQ